jgi:hypothetical protein
MPNDMVGPWRREDYDSFLALDVEFVPPQSGYGGLMSLGSLMALPSSRRQENEAQASKIEAAWKLRRNHPIFKSLSSDQTYRLLWKQFERGQTRAAPGSKLASPFAPFVFLKIVVAQVGWGYEVRGYDQRRRDRKFGYGPTATRRRAAIKHADALLELIAHGVATDYTVSAQLKSSLTALRDNLNAIPRKPRAGKGSMMRMILQATARDLNWKLDLSSPVMVEHIAALIDTPCDYRTATRHCLDARNARRQLLAAVLSEQAGQN